MVRYWATGALFEVGHGATAVNFRPGSRIRHGTQPRRPAGGRRLTVTRLHPGQWSVAPLVQLGRLPNIHSFRFRSQSQSCPRPSSKPVHGGIISININIKYKTDIYSLSSYFRPMPNSNHTSRRTRHFNHSFEQNIDLKYLKISRIIFKFDLFAVCFIKLILTGNFWANACYPYEFQK